VPLSDGVKVSDQNLLLDGLDIQKKEVVCQEKSTTRYGTMKQGQPLTKENCSSFDLLPPFHFHERVGFIACHLVNYPNNNGYANKIDLTPIPVCSPSSSKILCPL